VVYRFGTASAARRLFAASPWRHKVLRLMIMRLAAAKQIDQVARKRTENVALLAQSSLLGGMTGDQSDVACRTQPETLDRWPIQQGPEQQTFGASIQQTVIQAIPP
jgi:hypothetical protein